MKKRENWAEKFERQKEEKEEFVLNISKRRKLEEYNNSIRNLKEKYSSQEKRSYKGQIVVLENMLEIYNEIADLSIEEIDVTQEMKKLEENINYLKFKQQYLEENQVEEVDVKTVRAELEIKELQEEEERDNLRRKELTDNTILKLKEESDKSKDSQSWEEYKKEEEEEER